jgi:hypothetical protein
MLILCISFQHHTLESPIERLGAFVNLDLARRLDEALRLGWVIRDGWDFRLPIWHVPTLLRIGLIRHAAGADDRTAQPGKYESWNGRRV